MRITFGPRDLNKQLAIGVEFGASAPPQADVHTTPGYLLAFLMPLVGFILGITYLGRKTTDGIAVMVLSLLAAGFWLFVLSILLGVDPNAPDGY